MFGNNLYRHALKMGRLISALLALLLASASLSAQQQWLDYRTDGIPRTPDGKPNLSAPTPRTPDGKPDLSGVWAVQGSNYVKGTGGEGTNEIGGQAANGQSANNYAGNVDLFERRSLFLNLGWAVQGGIPYKPGVQEHARALADPSTGKTEEPHSVCLPDGFMVEHTWDAQLRKIVQTPKLLVLLMEYNSMYRQIPLDGRPLPVDPDPAWSGYSTGHWEGDTLVVQSSGFKDGQWLDTAADPFGETTKVTERFRRPDFGHLQIDVTIDDPTFYTKPWNVKVNEVYAADTDLLEFICLENEKDIQHMKAGANKGK
jgi:hypothetical protein